MPAARSGNAGSEGIENSAAKVSAREPSDLTGFDSSRDRKRARVAEDSRSDSEDENDSGFPVREGYWPRRVKPGTIKACNECRQQKVRRLFKALRLSPPSRAYVYGQA